MHLYKTWRKIWRKLIFSWADTNIGFYNSRVLQINVDLKALVNLNHGAFIAVNSTLSGIHMKGVALVFMLTNNCLLSFKNSIFSNFTGMVYVILPPVISISVYIETTIFKNIQFPQKGTIFYALTNSTVTCINTTFKDLTGNYWGTTGNLESESLGMVSN